MTPSGPTRSWLFSPGNQPEVCLKALDGGADQIIWDLGDAVAESDKDAALQRVRKLLQAAAKRPPWVRMNGLQTTRGLRELAIFAQDRAYLTALVVLKVDGDTVRILAKSSLGGPWLLLIESPSGLDDLLNAKARWAVHRARHATHPDERQHRAGSVPA